MTIEQMLAKLREQQAAKLAARATLTTAIQELRAKETPDEDAIKAKVNERATLDAELDQVAARVAELEAEKARNENAAELARAIAPQVQQGSTFNAGAVDAPGVDRDERGGGTATATRTAYDEAARIGDEPRTYTRHSARKGCSFFRDAWAWERRQQGAPIERLERHAREVEKHGEITERALATGGIAGLAVPQYLVDMAAPVLRAGRPLANLVNRHELPEDGMALIVPRGTTGASVASQATENTAVSSTDQAWTNLTVPVVTIAGQQAVSRQVLERGSGMDDLIWMDIVRAYAAEVDRQVINGTGTNNQMLGILNTSGINSATAYNAALSYALWNLKIAGQISAVTGAGAGIWPKLLVVHPRRWGWATGQVDGQGRPIVLAQPMGLWNAGAKIEAPGQISADGGLQGAVQIGTHSSGLPVISDLNIPTTVGANAEDVTLVLDPVELHLWEEGDGMPRQLRFEQTQGNSLTTLLVGYNYAAFTAGRYPAASGYTGGKDTTAGQGQVAPAF